MLLSPRIGQESGCTCSPASLRPSIQSHRARAESAGEGCWIEVRSDRCLRGRLARSAFPDSPLPSDHKAREPITRRSIVFDNPRRFCILCSQHYYNIKTSFTAGSFRIAVISSRGWRASAVRGLLPAACRKVYIVRDEKLVQRAHLRNFENDELFFWGVLCLATSIMNRKT